MCGKQVTGLIPIIFFITYYYFPITLICIISFSFQENKLNKNWVVFETEELCCKAPSGGLTHHLVCGEADDFNNAIVCLLLNAAAPVPRVGA